MRYSHAFDSIYPKGLLLKSQYEGTMSRGLVSEARFDYGKNKGQLEALGDVRS